MNMLKPQIATTCKSKPTLRSADHKRSDANLSLLFERLRDSPKFYCRLNCTKKEKPLNIESSAAILLASTLFAVPIAGAAATQTSYGDQFLPRSKFTLTSTLRINLTKGTATLPLHRGSFRGEPVYYVITDASSEGVARTLGVNFSPRLATLSNGCPGCVQTVTFSHATGTNVGAYKIPNVEFAGIPDFRPMRLLGPGPTAFPPAYTQPGAVADLHYSPFVRVAGSDIVYNATIVATGNAPFDVTTHTNTSDRTLAIDTNKMTVDLLFIRGFVFGKPILYLSSEASEPATATIERSTYVPALGFSQFPGGGGYPQQSARAEIFASANGKLQNPSPPGQGLAHVIVSGAGTIDANLRDGIVSEALLKGGDAHNILDEWPVADRAQALGYSPLWDLQIGVFTPTAVAAGANGAVTDANEFRELSVRKIVTSPGGVLPLAPENIVINCPALAFTETRPVGPVIPQPPGQL